MPVFGVRDTTLPQKTRSCAYAVIVNSQGLVAAVRGDSEKLLLPGGGIEPSEMAAEALRREVKEELGCEIRLTGGIGHALQYFTSDGEGLTMHAAFYAGVLGQRVQASHEHELEWVTTEQLCHPCHAWAARRQITAEAERLHEK